VIRLVGFCLISGIPGSIGRTCSFGLLNGVSSLSTFSIFSESDGVLSILSVSIELSSGVSTIEFSFSLLISITVLFTSINFSNLKIF